jgi:hypothetical protein
MTDAELDELEELDRECPEITGKHGDEWLVWVLDGGPEDHIKPLDHAAAEKMVKARRALPGLIAEVRRLREENARRQDAMDVLESNLAEAMNEPMPEDQAE